ncbi:hypothetical protein PAPYR_2956 [Paratrimastix pyriformis]|uniref:EXPERA domain-containing protein n=1 Tax=Paratrimastix pyriformis TaxID=342808 RepID=A0ABQ8UNG2_9EUKA|nr:hypothetical protein PAPYR_2956 [Paratrimastix pyriformis]
MKPFLFFVLVFCIVNFFFISYTISAEPLYVKDPHNVEKWPIWPPRPLLKALYAYADMTDPLLLARPAWYKSFMCLEVGFFGPFYALATYAILKKKDWIRIPCIVYSCVMLTKMWALLAEELFGVTKSPMPLATLGEHIPWVFIPLALLVYMWRHEHPFAEEKKTKSH